MPGNSRSSSVPESGTLLGRVLDAVAESGNKNVLACSGETLTGKGVVEHVLHNAKRLGDADLRPGDRLMVITGRGNQFWIDMLSALAAGCCAVPIPHDVDPKSFAHMRLLTRPVAVLGDDWTLDADTSGLNALELKTDAPLPAVSRPSSTSALAAKPSIILFTSGSTGLPKGVPLNDDAILTNATSTLSIHPMQPGDLVFASIPFRFVSALSHFLVTILGKGCFAGYEETLLAGDYIKTIEILEPQGVGGSPIQMKWVADSPSGLPESVRWIMSSGDRLPPETTIELQAKHPSLQIQIAYGMTELAGRFCLLPTDHAVCAADCVGIPIGCLETEIRDSTGTMVPSGVEGHVHAAGPCVFDGYLLEDGLDRSAFRDDAFDTGDLGVVMPSGFLKLTGRSNDVLKVAGRMISLVVIRDALAGAPGLADSTVVTFPHPDVGLVVVACYVPEHGVPISRRDVMRHLRACLPGDHMPFASVEVSAVPRTGSGKVDRTALNEIIGNLFGK